MLVDRINESLSRLELGVSVENAQTLKKDLDTLYSKLKSYESSIKLYMKETVETKKVLKCHIEEKEHIINILRRFGNDALEGKKDYALQDLQNIENEIMSGNKELKLIWSNYRLQTYSASVNLISALMNILDEDEKLDRLGVLRTNIEAKSIGNSQTVKDIKEFRELTEELIESKKMRGEVQDFVKKLAAGEEILLCQITDEIYEWMKKNKLDKKVGLTIISSN